MNSISVTGLIILYNENAINTVDVHPKCITQIHVGSLYYHKTVLEEYFQ